MGIVKKALKEAGSIVVYVTVFAAALVLVALVGQVGGYIVGASFGSIVAGFHSASGVCK